MKSYSAHIICSFVLALAGLLACFHCNAQTQLNRLQNQNLSYWESQTQSRRSQLSSFTVDLNYIFRSRVVCDSTLTSVRSCHVINRTQNTVTVSDAYGDFKISANIGDSITFSALGYETLTIVIDEHSYNYGSIVRLKPTVYELGEVTVQPYQLDFAPLTKWEVPVRPLPNQGGINIPTGIHPVTALYDRFSKEAKQKRYNKKILDGSADFMIIGEKFNGVLVAQITGLKDDELIRFMSFCNFSTDFLLNYSPETIKREIRKKFQEFVE